MADADKFGKGLKDGESRLSKFGGAAKKAGKVAAGAVAGVAALGAGAFAMANRVAGAGDEIHKASKRIGVSTDAYQELNYWADQNGISQGTMERAVGRLTQRMGQADAGNKKYSEGFADLGVSVRDTNGEMRDTESVLPEVIARLSEIENPAERSAAAAELLGTNTARQLQPALEDGALSLEDAAAQAHELGIVMDEEGVEASARFSDSLGDLKEGALGMLRQGAMPLVEFFADTAFPFIERHLLPLLQKFGEWLGDKLTRAARMLADFARDTLLPIIRRMVDWFRDRVVPALSDAEGFVSEHLVPTLRSLAEWFRDRVLPAARALAEWIMGTLVPNIRRTVVPIINALRDALQRIRERFEDNSDSIAKVMSVLRPLAAFITGTVAPIVGKVLGVALRTLGVIIGGVIDAVSWLIDRIDTVVGWFRRAYDWAKRLAKPLEKVADLAGKASDAASSVASGVGSKVSGAVSKIPGLASGGVVTQPTLAMVGEGAEHEAVLPLSKLEQLIGTGGGGITVNVTGAMMDPEGAARAVERALRSSQRRRGGGLVPA